MFAPRLSKFKIKKFKKEIEPQEIFLDSLARKEEQKIGISEKKLESPLSRKTLQGFWIVFLILTFIVFGKTFQLQIVEGETHSRLSAENQYVVHLIRSERGAIYDRDMRQIVFNKPRFDLVCDGEIVEENLDHQTLIFYEVKINEFPGCEIKNNTSREYLDGYAFSHLVGYQRRTGEKTGLERYYDELLKEKPGELQIERDVYGNPISKEIIAVPESGQSLVLHLDAGLQRKVVQVLENSIRSIGAKGGAVVALDPQTGGVLALASFPNFDNNLFSQGMSQEQWQALDTDPNDPLFNRAISGRYLTGSTIKPLVAAAALEEGIISPEKNMYCLGQITIPNPWDPNASSTKRDWRAHGWVDLRKAIAESCNVYFYTIGGGYEQQDGLGPTKIKEYLELFGWSEKTGVDLPEEMAGFVPDKEWKRETWGQGWWDGDTYNLAIGQGFILITPVEVAASFAAIANGGKLFEPRVVQKVLDGQEFEPNIIRENFITPENLQIVREGMRQAVTGRGSPYASAVLLSSLPVSAAAKTGTAELGNDRYHNWITVFAPYDDPQIVLTVMIEDVKGSQVAALPAAKEMLGWYFMGR